ncbi:hypothetical protein ACNKHR_25570 [Shigella flexneri]
MGSRNRYHLFYVLEQQIEHKPVPQSRQKRYLEFLKGYLIRNMPSLSAKEIQTAYL